MRGRLLLTGGSGFIGRACLPALLEAGYEVHALSRSPRMHGGRGTAWHACDLLDGPAVGRLLDELRPSHLVHVAWYVEHGKFWSAPENLEMLAASQRLFEAFGRAGGRRAVGFGTCAEYAFGPPVLDELTSPLVPASIYGQAKAAAGLALQAASGVHGFSAAWGRLFFPYGPGAPAKQFLPSLAAELLAGRDFAMSDGLQVRDFVHVSDVASAVVALAGSEISGPVNVGTGQGVSLREVAECLHALAGSRAKLQFGAKPRATFDPDSIVAATARLQETGWRPAIDLDAGLPDVLKECRAAQGPGEGPQ